MSAKREKRRQILAEPSIQDESRQEDSLPSTSESAGGWTSNQTNNNSSSSYHFRPISSLSSAKTQSDILSSQRLLEANYLEATKASPLKKVIGKDIPKETPASKAKRTKSRQQKNELSSLLMILFGSLLLIGRLSALSATELTQVGHKSILFNNNNNTATVDVPPSGASASNESELAATTLAPTRALLAIVVASNSTLQSASLVVQASNNKTIEQQETIASANSKKTTLTNEITTRDFESRSSSPSFTTTTTTTTTPTPSAALIVEQQPSAPQSQTDTKAANSSAGSATTTTSTTTTSAPTTLSEEVGGVDNDGESGPSEASEDSGGENKLTSVLLPTVGEAADQLVKRAKAASSEQPREGEQRGEGEESEENADSDESPPTIDASKDQRRNEENAKQQEQQNEHFNLGGERSNDNKKASVSPRMAASALLVNKTRTGEENSGDAERKEQLRLAMSTYATWRSAADELIELFAKKLLPLVVEHGYDVDPVTVTGLLQVFNGVRAIKPWALKLLDASAKISSGLLRGTQSDFGDYDECLNVRVDDPNGLAAGGSIPDELDPETGLRQSTLIGRYCLADIEFPKAPKVKLAQRNEQLQTDYAPIELRRPLLNFSQTAGFKDTIFVETGNFLHMLYVDPIRVGICLTNKIDPDSLAKVANKVFEEFKVTINFRGRCVTKYDKPVWTIQQKVSAWVLVVACSLVLLSTLLEILHLKLHKLPLPSSLDKWKLNVQYSMLRYRALFTSFSLVRNTQRLFEPLPSTTLESALSQTNQQQRQMQDGGSQLMFGNNSRLGQTRQHKFHVLSSSALTGSNSSDSALSKSLVSSSTASFVESSSESSSESGESESSPTTGRRLAASSSNNNKGGDCKQTRQLAHFQQAQTTTKQAGTISARLMMTSRAGEREKRAANNLLCLHGIRVITMTWMIVNHTYLFGGFFVLWAHRRLIDIAEWPKSVSFQLVLNGWLTVETYFFLSAAIIVMATIPLIRARKFSYCRYVAHRLVRLLPAYGGLVCLNFLWPLVSSGPVWLVKGKSFIQTPCENYLWANFLFVSNWLWPENQCMVHTWFLSADFQLYLLAPLVVYLLYRRPILGHSLNILVAIVASIFSGFVIYANKLLPTTLINKLEFDSIKQQLSYSYFATYQHMGPYCLGIFIGYTLHKRPQVRLPKHLTWLLWLLLPPLSFTTLLLTYLWNGAYDEPELINPSPLVSAFYVAIHRTIWTSLVAWIVFACATGRARLLSSFLSHQFFVPLSRLSFSIYLVHLPVILFRALNLRYTVEWSDSNILWEACGNFMASLAVGYFVNIVFESPIINLERFFTGRDRQVSATNGNKRTTTKTGGLVHCLSSCGELESRPADEELVNVLKPNSNLKNLLGTQRPTLLTSKTIVSGEEMRKVVPSMSGNDNSSSSSSPESERKLTKSSADRQEALNLEYSEPIRRRSSSLRPNQRPTSLIGASRGFADETSNQMESPTAQQASGRRTSFQQMKSPPADDSIQHGRSNQRRYSAYTEALFADNESRYREHADQIECEPNDSIYPISSEFQHYARTGFHLPRINPAAALTNTSGARVSQYATLSRAGRFGAGGHQARQASLYHQYPMGSRRGNWATLQSNSRASSHLGEPRGHESSAGWPQHYSGNGQHQAPSISRQRGNLLVHNRNVEMNQQQKQHHQQRQGRYNTMGGSGTREWMRNYASSFGTPGEDSNLQIGSYSSPNNSSTSQSNGSAWLQPGTLIPRIDSSTLRRQTMRPEQANSIVEEHEDTVSDDKVNL